MFSPPLRSVDYYFAMLRSFLIVFLPCFLLRQQYDIYIRLEGKQVDIRL